MCHAVVAVSGCRQAPGETHKVDRFEDPEMPVEVPAEGGKDLSVLRTVPREHLCDAGDIILLSCLAVKLKKASSQHTSELVNELPVLGTHLRHEACRELYSPEREPVAIR